MMVEIRFNVIIIFMGSLVFLNFWMCYMMDLYCEVMVSWDVMRIRERVWYVWDLFLYRDYVGVIIVKLIMILKCIVCMDCFVNLMVSYIFYE